MIADQRLSINTSAAVPLPPLDCYWNPGEPTAAENIKLMLLHHTAQFSGLLSRFCQRSSQRVFGILTYHRISENYAGVPFPSINVTPATFRRQLLGLRQAGFHFASLSSVLKACAADDGAQELPDRIAVVTFDDIFDNVYSNAYPVLRELQIPATFFVSSAFIDSPDPFLFDPWGRRYRDDVPASAWTPITSEHLHEMLQSGCAEAGAHTHTHQDFRHRPEAFADDLQQNMEQLTEFCGTTPLPFAFPYGSPRLGFAAECLMEVVKKFDLRCGLTTGSHTNRLSTCPFGWGRFHVFEHDTPTSLTAKLDGWYEWLPRLKNAVTGDRPRSSSSTT